MIIQWGWIKQQNNTSQNITLPRAFTKTYSVVRDVCYGGGNVSWVEANGEDGVALRTVRTLTYFVTGKCTCDWLAIGY